MRVISGTLKGRRFSPPAGKWPTRPTTDYAREGLFNILQNKLAFEELICLDLFGGAGSHTFELVSRGCEDVTYVDQFAPCVKFVSETAVEWGIDDFITIHRQDVRHFLSLAGKKKYDYIFAGPPYPLTWLDDIPNLIFEADILAEDGLFVLEHNPNRDFSAHPHFRELRKYGKTYFSLFRH